MYVKKMYVPHIIIGGGIAGCYIACQLHAKNKEYVLFESSARPHDKLHSVHVGGVTLELGASIFHNNQPKLFNMIKYLGLYDKVRKLKKSTKRYIFGAMQSGDVEAEWNRLYKKTKEYAQERAQHTTMTVEENARKCLTKRQFELLKTCWDCWYENANMNAYAFYKQAGDAHTFYHLEGGLGQLIEAAMRKCNPRILMNHKVTSVAYNGTVYELRVNDRIFMCRDLYVCVSLDELDSIHFITIPSPSLLPRYDLESRVNVYKQLAHTESSLRYFILLNRDIHIDGYIIGQVWFKWMIRMTPSIYMIYVDHELADSLNKLTDAELVQGWMEFINMMYGYSLQPSRDCKRVIRGYWPHAYTVLNKEYFESEEVTLPFVCTALPSPLHQAYMEGHLVDVVDVVM